MSDKPVDYLGMAMNVIHEDFDEWAEYTSAYAAIAQAQALTRIAECLETIIDDMAQIKRTLEKWEGEL